MNLKTIGFNLFVTLSTSIVFAQLQVSSWIRIKLPTAIQTSQFDIGFANGCEITTILYALKFGPVAWHLAYSNILEIQIFKKSNL